MNSVPTRAGPNRWQSEDPGPVGEQDRRPPSQDQLFLLSQEPHSEPEPTEYHTNSIHSSTQILFLTLFLFLGALPSELGQLAKLETLVLSSNRLTSLPASLSKLANLKVVNLRSV